MTIYLRDSNGLLGVGVVEVLVLVIVEVRCFVVDPNTGRLFEGITDGLSKICMLLLLLMVIRCCCCC